MEIRPSGGDGSASEDAKPKRVRELVVKAWEGPIDQMELNNEMLRIIREADSHLNCTEAEMSRRYDIKRQHLHNLHTEKEMTLTVPMMTRWCNARKLDSAYLMAVAELAIRQRHALICHKKATTVALM